MTIRSHNNAASQIKSGAIGSADAKRDEGAPDNRKSERTESIYARNPWSPGAFQARCGLLRKRALA